MTRWLVIVVDDLEPHLEGPFKTDRARVIAAQEHRKKDLEKHDGLFRLDVTASGSPRMYNFVSCEVNPEPAVIGNFKPSKIG